MNSAIIPYLLYFVFINYNFYHPFHKVSAASIQPDALTAAVIPAAHPPPIASAAARIPSRGCIITPTLSSFRLPCFFIILGFQTSAPQILPTLPRTNPFVWFDYSTYSLLQFSVDLFFYPITTRKDSRGSGGIPSRGCIITPTLSSFRLTCFCISLPRERIRAAAGEFTTKFAILPNRC